MLSCFLVLRIRERLLRTQIGVLQGELGPTFSPFPPDQLLERIYAHQHRVVSVHLDITLLKVFLVDLVRVARAIREKQRDEEGLR